MKLTKKQLKQIIKEELESALAEEETNTEDELFGPEAMIEIPTLQLKEDLTTAITTMPLGHILAIGALTGVVGLYNILHLAPFWPQLKKDLQEFREEFRAKKGDIEMEFQLVKEMLASDKVLTMKIEKYLEIVEIVEKNKGKRSPELTLIRKRKTPLSKEITADISSKMEEYGRTISSPGMQAVFSRHVKRGIRTVDIRKELIKKVADRLSKAEESSALTQELNAAIKTMKGKDQRQQKLRARQAQRAKGKQL